MKEVETIKQQIRSAEAQSLPMWRGQNELAIWHLRQGDAEQARIICLIALSETDDGDGQATLTATLAHALCDLGKHKTARTLMFEFDTSRITDPLVLAKYQHNNANVLDESGEYERALIEYAGAAAYFEMAGHQDRAEVAANTASVYVKIGQSEKAHTELDKAEAHFRSIYDHAALAQALETRARAYLAQNRCDEAYKTINESLSLLTDEKPLILESLITKGRILAQMKRMNEQEQTRLALILADGNLRAAGKMLELSGTAIANRIKADQAYTGR
jgi:tetratricopeptide (TPR) repeat protein